MAEGQLVPKGACSCQGDPPGEGAGNRGHTLDALRGVGFDAGPGGSLLLAFIRSGLEPVLGFEPRTDGSQSRQAQPPESSISVLVHLPFFVASRENAEA